MLNYDITITELKPLTLEIHTPLTSQNHPPPPPPQHGDITAAHHPVIIPDQEAALIDPITGHTWESVTGNQWHLQAHCHDL